MRTPHCKNDETGAVSFSIRWHHAWRGRDGTGGERGSISRGPTLVSARARVAQRLLLYKNPPTRDSAALATAIGDLHDTPRICGAAGLQFCGTVGPTAFAQHAKENTVHWPVRITRGIHGTSLAAGGLRSCCTGSMRPGSCCTKSEFDRKFQVHNQAPFRLSPGHG